MEEQINDSWLQIISTWGLALLLVMVVLSAGVFYFYSVWLPDRRKRLAIRLDKEAADAELQRTLAETLPRFAERQAETIEMIHKQHQVTNAVGDRVTKDVHARIDKVAEEVTEVNKKVDGLTQQIVRTEE